MKTVLVLTLIIAGFFGIITALAKPEVLMKKYQEARAPIDKYLLDREMKIWTEAKEKEQASWMINTNMPNGCTEQASALKALECKTAIHHSLEAFENNWANKVRNGWKPNGAS
jgi:hypothetical protein